MITDAVEPSEAFTQSWKQSIKEVRGGLLVGHPLLYWPSVLGPLIGGDAGLIPAHAYR